MPFAELKILSGPLKGQNYPLRHQEILLGRRQGCQIHLTDYPEVSGEHALLFWNGSLFVIRDLNSSNGVKVDGTAQREAPLKDGARIQLGDFVAQLSVPSVVEFKTAPPAPVKDATPPPVPPSPRFSPWPTVASIAAIAVLAGIVTSRPTRTAVSASAAVTKDKPASVAVAERQKAPVQEVSKTETPTVEEKAKTESEKAVTPLTPTEMSQENVQRAMDATVLIVMPVEGGYALGSGYVVGDGKWILTNRHVVTDKGETGNLAIVFHSGTKRQQEMGISKDNIVAMSPVKDFLFETDLALIRLDKKVVEPLPIGDTATLKPLDTVIAFGFPNGTQVNPARPEIPTISVMKHNVEKVSSYLQIGGTATHGNSGGPVLNYAGEVVGMVEAGTPSEKSVICIPTSAIKAALQLSDGFLKK